MGFTDNLVSMSAHYYAFLQRRLQIINISNYAQMKNHFQRVIPFTIYKTLGILPLGNQMERYLAKPMCSHLQFQYSNHHKV